MGNIPLSVLRQPPPPPGRGGSKDGSQTTEVNQRNSEMTRHNPVPNNRRSRPFYSRSCKKTKPTDISSLPDDIVFKILLHLPAQDIYNVTRLVCPQWYRTIHSADFINEHLNSSPRGLLIQNIEDKTARTSPIFAYVDRGQIEISKLDYKFRDMVWTSCNGLILEGDLKARFTVIVANPATKQHFSIPTHEYHIDDRWHTGLGYVPTSMEYKVVHTFDSDFYVLTLGVDDVWRRVECGHLTPPAKKLLRRLTPLVTEGYMHWVHPARNIVVMLDLEKEGFRQLRGPPGKKRGNCGFLEGDLLSCYVRRGWLSWGVWELRPGSEEWEKVMGIELGGRAPELENLCGKDGGDCDWGLSVVGWIKYKEVLVFRVSCPSRVCIAYSVRTGELRAFKLDCEGYKHNYLPHRSSLVWLGGT
ncbi:F-box and associated interaction domains-containing protein [Striga asiatica]|uniref:F-box and associated interaction domains-containing protein n=1 Tax=Striga asiatica TaxID=4170 RepID=A0A5A7Q952_STRAF|nr:F-box and associated interaction domains-containing protein [Striga asiatica]